MANSYWPLFDLRVRTPRLEFRLPRDDDLVHRWDPAKNIIRWSWVKHEEYVQRYEAAMADPSLGMIEFIRLRSALEIKSFLERA
jgi:hypothetical protein